MICAKFNQSRHNFTKFWTNFFKLRLYFIANQSSLKLVKKRSKMSFSAKNILFWVKFDQFRPDSIWGSLNLNLAIELKLKGQIWHIEYEIFWSNSELFRVKFEIRLSLRGFFVFWHYLSLRQDQLLKTKLTIVSSCFFHNC